MARVMQWLLAVLVLSGAVGCERPPASGGPIKAVCTVGMITDIVGHVGGSRVEAVGIMGEGVDPHLYKASPGDVRLLEDATIVFYNGLHLEGKMGDMLEKLSKRKPVVAVAENIDPSLLRSPPEFQGAHDPHIWFDVTLWMKAVERVREALIAQDPPGAAEYEKNAGDYLRTLTTLHETVSREIASIPEASRVLVTAHDAFGYFGRAYGIEVRAIQGISTEGEASLKDMNDLVDMLHARKIKAVFVESSVPRKTIDALVEGCRSKGHDIKIGGELYSDAMGPAGTPEGTYEGMVLANVSKIVEALK